MKIQTLGTIDFRPTTTDPLADLTLASMLQREQDEINMEPPPGLNQTLDNWAVEQLLISIEINDPELLERDHA